MSRHSGPDVEPIVAVLIAEWAVIAALLDGLEPEAWSTPTALPGWTVHDVVAHMVGTESSLAGEAVREHPIDTTEVSHVRNEIGVTNERWVQHLRADPPEQLLDRFRDVTRRRGAALTAMRPHDFDALTPTPVGEASYRRFMEIRVFDCWMHEQDIRDATGRSGHEDGPAAEASVDEIARALGYLVGKRAAAPDGSTVSIELTGPVHRTLHVAVDGRAHVVAALDRPATASLRLSSSLFVLLAGGRTDPGTHLHEIRFDGDPALGRRLATNLAYTI
jgi:uncharacterized protein (TIGR03083 family)